MKPQLLLLLPVVLLIAANDFRDGTRERDAATNERTALEGTWDTISVAYFGNTIDGDKVNDVPTVFEGQKMKVGNEAIYRTDPRSSPPAIDVTPSDGPAKGQTFRGIYLLRDQTLVIWLGSNEAPFR